MKSKEAGQGLVEYAVILVLLAIVVIAVMRFLGPILQSTFCAINNGNPDLACVAAEPDVAVTSVDAAVDIDATNNDYEFGALPASISVLVGSYPANGDLENHGDGTFTYAPAAGFKGVDSFEYIISTSNDEDEAKVSIGVGVEVVASDDPGICTAVNTPAPIDIVYNDFVYPPEGYTVEMVDIPDHGTLEVIDALGVYRYTPAPDYEGPDGFSYSICSSQVVCDDALATITVGDCSAPAAMATFKRSMTLLDVQQSAAPAPDGTAMRNVREKLGLLMVDAYAQDAAISAASLTFKELVTVMANILNAPAEIAQDFNSGDPELVVASSAALNLLLEQAPEDLLEQVIAGIRYPFQDGCSALEGAEVSSYEPAMEALYALEELYPGSAGDTIAELEEIEPVLQLRNSTGAICVRIINAFLDFDDLHQAIADAQIDDEEIRNELANEAMRAERAFEEGKIKQSGNGLCTILNLVNAQDGKHIDPASATALRDVTTSVAGQLGIALRCHG